MGGEGGISSQRKEKHLPHEVTRQLHPVLPGELTKIPVFSPPSTDHGFSLTLLSSKYLSMFITKSIWKLNKITLVFLKTMFLWYTLNFSLLDPLLANQLPLQQVGSWYTCLRNKQGERIVHCILSISTMRCSQFHFFLFFALSALSLSPSIKEMEHSTVQEQNNFSLKNL